MRARRHEEIFEECLSALLENRRSIDESLSLYPSLADHLEPLLRAAAEVSNSLEFPLPPAEFEEELRRRFLVLASNRRRARALVPLSNHGSALWGKPRWIVLVGATVLAVGVSVVLGLALSPSTDESPPPTVTTLGTLTAAHSNLRIASSSGDGITAGAILEITEATNRLAAHVDEPSRVEGLEQAIRDQFVLLHEIAEAQSVDLQPEVTQALGLTEDLATRWGFDLPALTPGATDTPIAAEDSPTPSPPLEPSETPSSGDAP